MDQLSGNTAALARTQQALLAFETQHAGQLGLDKSDLALMAAQNNAANLATNPVTNIHPFYQKQPGLSAFEAGEGSTLVRAGGIDPSTQEIRVLRRELAEAQAENTQLLQQIVNNTKVALSS